jgi:hypothetical protein
MDLVLFNLQNVRSEKHKHTHTQETSQETTVTLIWLDLYASTSGLCTSLLIEILHFLIGKEF